MSGFEAWNKVKSNFNFPFELHEYQQQGVEDVTKASCRLLKYRVGLGKTCVATAAALYHTIENEAEQIIVLCPPILINQWAEWLRSVEGIPSVEVFRGTPAQRKGMDIESASVVIMSYNVFRGADYDRIRKMLEMSKTCIIADELSLKSLSTSTYKKLRALIYRKQRVQLFDRPYHQLIALNATPLSDPMHTYNCTNMLAPGLYRNLNQFKAVHAEHTDPWGQVLKWKNEEDMAHNMGLISVDTNKSVRLPEKVVVDVTYDLEKEHLELYKDVKSGLLSELPEDKIELAANSMFSTLQRLVVAPQEFGLDIRSPVMDYIDAVLDQVPEDEGVLIYTRHVIVSKMIAEYFGDDCVAIYGGVSQKVRDEGIAMLKSGEKRILVGNLDSLGVGINAQFLNHIIFVELPFRDDKKTQAEGRVYRQGQQKTCTIHYPLAKGTIQAQIYKRLLQNGESIERIMKDKTKIIEFLEG